MTTQTQPRRQPAAPREPRMTLASIYEAAGKHDEARAVLAEWLQQHPDAEDVRSELARLGDGAPGHSVAKR